MTEAELAAELRFAVMRLRRRLANERHPDNPLSLSSMVVLGTLVRDGDLTVGELAASERVKPPTMTRTVSCLEEDGYVVRRPHERDGRQIVVSLTARGERTLIEDRRRRTAWLAQRLEGLSAEEQHALAAAAPLLQRLAEED